MMIKYIVIAFVLLFAVGCTTYTRYYEDHQIRIVGVELLESNEDYQYWYTIEIYIRESGYARSVGVSRAYLYSNKRYGMGDIIWIGARWGKHYEKE